MEAVVFFEKFEVGGRGGRAGVEGPAEFVFSELEAVECHLLRAGVEFHKSKRARAGGVFAGGEGDCEKE